MITGISGFGFFLSKNVRFVTHNCFFPKMPCWNPYFIVFWGCALSGPSCQKGIFGQPRWLITEKRLFWHFCVFLHVLYLFFLFLFFGGLFFFVLFLASLRPKSSLFLFCFCFVFLLFFLWATSLGPKPSLFLFCFVLFLFLFSFPFFASKRQKTCRPPRKGHLLFIFECLPLFLLSLFWPPPFSISLSLSLSCSILSFFLLVFLFCFLFVPYFSLFLSLSFFFAFVSWKEQHQSIKLLLFFLKYFLFFGVSCLGVSVQSLFLSLFFPDFKLCFLFNINVFGFKKQSWKTPIFGQKGGCNKTVFLWTCVLQNVKSDRLFCPIFCPILVDVQKHYKNRYFSTFLKAKQAKKLPFWGVIIWAK